MALIKQLEQGDRIQLGAVFGFVERIVHYGGAFDVRIAIRQGNGELAWCGANYSDSCKRLRGPQRRADTNPVRRYSDIRDRPMAAR